MPEPDGQEAQASPQSPPARFGGQADGSDAGDTAAPAKGLGAAALGAGLVGSAALANKNNKLKIIMEFLIVLSKGITLLQDHLCYCINKWKYSSSS